MIPIAICDDELLHARQTQAAIRRCEAQAVTRCFETPLALLAAVTQQGYAPRVAVLDIRMAGMDGIELAKRLNALVPGCAVIFLTAYLSYAPDVYETRHVYFVLKSELDRRIGSALRAALAETAAPASLQLATAHGYRNVPVTDVLFLERILRKIQTKLILVELHAEATSEKLAMGRMLDGQVSAVWGTHTHVPTADTMILPQGTGYVTDLGMTGPRDSVLGIRPELSIRRFRGDLPSRYEPAPGPCKLEACLFTIDDATGRCTAVRRVDIHG